MSLLSFFGVSATSDRDPTSGFWYGPVGRKTAAGVDVNENTVANYSGAWACTRLLCATGSCLPLNMMRKLGPQRREIADAHSAQRVLHHEFNPEMGAMMGRAFGINMQVNWGNFYAEIVREFGTRGKIKELWPMHSSRVQVMRSDDGDLGYRVNNDDGSTDDFRREEIFHVPSMISCNGIQGKGVIQNARESIGAALATERHGAAYFGNGAVPGVIIKGGKFKTKEDRDDYRRQWLELFGGPDKHHKPALLPEGADVSFLAFHARDSQFLELREHNINEMARWYGVPPHMIYDLRRATYSNIEHQGIDFVVYSLIPWLKLWEEEIWRKLLTPEEQQDHFAKHSIEGLLRGDSAARAAFYTSLWNIGVLSINDILELEDRNGIGPDGDKRFVQLNMTTVDKAGTLEDVGVGDTEQGVSEVEEAKINMDAYGVGVRAVAITPQTVAAPSNEALVVSARGVLSETLGRMLNKECRACESAAKNNRNPKDFYAWLDDYYERYGATLATAIAKPLGLYMIASADARQSAAVLAENVMNHVAKSKEDVLRATEVVPADWGAVPARIAACGVRWQSERTIT